MTEPLGQWGDVGMLHAVSTMRMKSRYC